MMRLIFVMLVINCGNYCQKLLAIAWTKNNLQFLLLFFVVIIIVVVLELFIFVAVILIVVITK